MRSRTLLMLLVVSGAWVGSPTASAQLPRTPYIQFNQTGKITQLAPRGVQLENEHGESFAVSLMPQQAFAGAGQVQIVVNGPLSRDGLKKGMTVQFQAVIGDDGVVAEGLTKLLASSKKSLRKLAPIPVADPNLPAGTVSVVGPIVGFEDGKLTVAIRNGEVTATVPEYAEIKMEGVDPKLVRPGDKIYVRGFSVAPSGQAPQYFAQFVSIDLATPVDQRGAGKN